MDGILVWFLASRKARQGTISRMFALQFMLFWLVSRFSHLRVKKTPPSSDCPTKSHCTSPSLNIQYLTLPPCITRLISEGSAQLIIQTEHKSFLVKAKSQWWYLHFSQSRAHLSLP